MQFWHDLGQLPPDVEECVRSWTVWGTSGFKHRLFDERTAGAFISHSLGARHKQAFERCYHPAMQADYFRLCYVLVEGGIYVDADDVCVGNEIGWLAEDWRLKLQPLCYDIATGKMVKPAVFLRAEAYDPSWIFYFNNNPLIAGPGHPIIEHALSQATRRLEIAGKDELSRDPDCDRTRESFEVGLRSWHEDQRRYREWCSYIGRLGCPGSFALVVELPQRCEELSII